MSGAAEATAEIPQRPEPTWMEYWWVRGRDKIRYTKDDANVILAFGERNAGKSALLECFGEQYLSRGHSVLDLFGASSGEGLAWLRSPWANECEPLIIKGQNMDVKCSWHCLSWNEVTLRDLEKHQIVISAGPLYYRTMSYDEEFPAVEKILSLLVERHGWQKAMCIIIREASRLLFSRKKKYEEQSAARTGAVWLLQEGRHHGLALVADAQKSTSMDTDVRALADFRIFKAQGSCPIPKDYWYIFNELAPHWLRSMRKDEFAILSKNDSIGMGYNHVPSWHKKASENILDVLGIQVSFSTDAPSANFRAKNIMRDSEHVSIIKLYKESDSSMDQIGKVLGWASNQVPYREINRHNDSVMQLHYCPTCISGKGEYSRVLLEKKKRGVKPKPIS